MDTFDLLTPIEVELYTYCLEPPKRPPPRGRPKTRPSTLCVTPRLKAVDAREAEIPRKARKVVKSDFIVVEARNEKEMEDEEKCEKSL